MKKIFIYLFAIFMLVIGFNVVKAEESYDYNKLMDNYIEKWKNVEIFGEKIGNIYKITTTDGFVHLSALDDEDNSVKLSHEYKDGILTYIPLIKVENPEQVSTLTEEELSTLIGDNMIAATTILALADLKGYDKDKVEEWLDKNKDTLTLEKDGIEYKTGKYQQESQNESGSFSMSIEYLTSLKLDLKNGLKTFTAEENNKNNSTQNNTVKVENPKTGIEYKYGILIVLALISGASFIALRKKSKFVKHN